jgi:hypothetical protein
MKKGLPVLFAALAVALLAAGCGSAPEAQQNANANLPPWINEIAPEGVIWGVGSAKQSTLQQSMTFATNRARVAIAQELDSQVQSMLTDYTRDAGSVTNQNGITLQESISRTLTDYTLSGAKVVQNWENPKDGTYWVRAELSVADAKSATVDVFNSASADFAEFQAARASDLMDAQLAKRSAAPPVRVEN